MGSQGFRIGDRVLVRSAEEILRTLDQEGTLDKVPFMPEMLASCGKSFRILRRVEKTCVDGYSIRRFPGGDVVILDGPRCDGSSHDGCKHGCRIFWKEAWLRPLVDQETAHDASGGDVEALRVRLKVKADERRYFCQSTELLQGTESFPEPRRLLTVRIALREIRDGDLGVIEFCRMFAAWAIKRAYRAVGGNLELFGPQKRTPSESLGLQPGELVRVKSSADIARTLDHRSRNRGMSFCHEMTKCCGHVAEVRYRVDRIIDERTGIMREIPDTVALKGIKAKPALCEECLCQEQLGDCPRGEIMYWREIWLERVDPVGASGGK